MKPAAIARWAEVAPPRMVGLAAPFSLTHRRAPRATKLWSHDASTGDFRDSAVSRASLPVLRDTAARLDAGTIVFRAADSFSPSTANRELLRRFFTEIATPDALGGVQRIWVPGGLWEVHPAIKLATELGVTCAFDPLVREPGEPLDIYFDLDASALYLRIEGTRAGPLRGERLADLAELAEHYGPAVDLTIVFATAERWHDARSLKKLLASAA